MFRTILESQTLLINQQSLKREESYQKVYKFGFGQSPFHPPSFVREELRKYADSKQYSEVQGDLELRKRVARFHHDYHGVHVQEDDVMIAPGSKSLLYTLLAAFEPLDYLIPQPSWVSYAPQGELLGHHNVRITSSFEQRWRVTPEALRDALAQKQHKDTVLILNYPGNPDGLTYTQKELMDIAEVVREQNIYVISDEIYGLLSFGEHHSFARYYPERTFTTSGLSKWCGAGGWRLGVLLMPDAIDPTLKRTLLGIASETYSCAPVPVQMAARAAYLPDERISSYIDRQKRVLNQIADHCYEVLTAAGVKLHKPQGGFYMFPDFELFRDRLAQRDIHTSQQLCAQLIEDCGVALLPGTAFGVDAHQLVARLAYVDFDDPLGHTDFDIYRDCPRVVEGVQVLVDWLNG